MFLLGSCVIPKGLVRVAGASFAELNLHLPLLGKGVVPTYTLRQTNIAMEDPPLEDVFPIGKGEFLLPC